MSDKLIKLLHYRNATYQGHVKNNKRNGKGILITDNGEIIVGQWKNDLLYGWAFLFVNSLEYGMAQFNRGELQGWAMFKSNDKMLVSEFNFNRPINKQLLINSEQKTVKVIIPKSPIFQIISQNSYNPSSQTPTDLIYKYLGAKQIFYSLEEFIMKQICQEKKDGFELQTLSNGYKIFKFNDESNPVSLGFIVTKNQQLISYGSYVNNKLTGFGCKYQNTTRYEGIFQNGFLNGDGLKLNAGKYSFGLFENGTLIEPIYLQERSLASEQKLKELKKIQHMKSMNYWNSYLRPNLLKFKGIQDVKFEINLKQEYLFSQTNDRSPTKKTNLATKILNSSKVELLQNKSSKSLLLTKGKNPEEYEDPRSQIGRSFAGGLSGLKKFKL